MIDAIPNFLKQLATDDLQWSKLLLEEFRKNGVPGLR